MFWAHGGRSNRPPEPVALVVPDHPNAEGNAERETYFEDLLHLIYQLEEWERRHQPHIDRA